LGGLPIQNLRAVSKFQAGIGAWNSLLVSVLKRYTRMVQIDRDKIMQTASLRMQGRKAGQKDRPTAVPNDYLDALGQQV
jgi:hypothetical protein